MHKTAYEDAQKFVEKYLKLHQSLTIADIGSCDINGTLRPLFDKPNWKYTGYDLAPGKNVDVVLSGQYSWPEIESESYDVVVATQVIEHVCHPWRWIKEVARICKQTGIIYLCSPNTIEFHEFPVDCWRIWPDGMKALLEEANLIPIEVFAHTPIGAIGDTTGIAKKRVARLLI